MQFLVVNLLPADASTEARLAIRPQHIAYTQERGHLIVSSGRLSSDDGTEVLGGYYVLECENRAEAEAFMAAEPYRTNGIWQTEFITAIA